MARHFYRRVCRLPPVLMKANAFVVQNFHTPADDVPRARRHSRRHTLNFYHILAAFYTSYLLPPHHRRRRDV